MQLLILGIKIVLCLIVLASLAYSALCAGRNSALLWYSGVEVSALIELVFMGFKIFLMTSLFPFTWKSLLVVVIVEQITWAINKVATIAYAAELRHSTRLLTGGFRHLASAFRTKKTCLA